MSSPRTAQPEGYLCTRLCTTGWTSCAFAGSGVQGRTILARDHDPTTLVQRLDGRERREVGQMTVPGRRAGRHPGADAVHPGGALEAVGVEVAERPVGGHEPAVDPVGRGEAAAYRHAV